MTARSVEGIELAARRANVNDTIRYRWRRTDVAPSPRSEGPEGLAVTAAGGVEGVEAAVSIANVDHAVCYGG